MEKDIILKEFADNLRAERARKYFTQEYLAEKADITQEYLARLESGRNNPSLVVVVKLALALGVPIEKLVSLT